MMLKSGIISLDPYHGHLPGLLEMTLNGGIVALYPTFQAFRRLTIMCVQLANVLRHLKCLFCSNFKYTLHLLYSL